MQKLREQQGDRLSKTAKKLITETVAIRLLGTGLKVVGNRYTAHLTGRTRGTKTIKRCVANEALTHRSTLETDEKVPVNPVNAGRILPLLIVTLPLVCPVSCSLWYCTLLYDQRVQRIHLLTPTLRATSTKWCFLEIHIYKHTYSPHTYTPTHHNMLL